MVAKKKSSGLTKNLRISAPASTKGKKSHKIGGFPPALIPILGAAGLPIAKSLGEEAVKGVSWLVKKIRGKGVVRSGNTARMGGAKKKTGKGVLRSGSTRKTGGANKKIKRKC